MVLFKFDIPNINGLDLARFQFIAFSQRNLRLYHVHAFKFNPLYIFKLV